MAPNHSKEWQKAWTHSVHVLWQLHFLLQEKKVARSLFGCQWQTGKGVCFLTLASTRWLACHCLPGPFWPLGFPPFQGSSSVDDNTPRQAVWQCRNISALELNVVTEVSLGEIKNVYIFKWAIWYYNFNNLLRTNNHKVPHESFVCVYGNLESDNNVSPTSTRCVTQHIPFSHQAC